MMAVGVDRRFSVFEMGPQVRRQMVQLSQLGPAFDISLMALVLPNHFLQKNDVRLLLFDDIANFMKNETQISTSKPLVDVIGKNLNIQGEHFYCVPRPEC